MTISSFFDTALTIFDHLIECSWRAGLVILVVLAIRAALGRRLTGRWLYALWLIAMLRLALPWVPETSWNPLPGGANIHSMIAPQIPATPVPQTERLTQRHSPDQDLNLLPTDSATTSTKALAADQSSYDAKPVWTLRQVICLIWMAGVVTLGGFICLNVAMLRRGVVGERLLTDASVLDLLEDCKRQMRITVPIGIVVTDKIGSPALFGFIRPRLLIPCGVLESLQYEELRHVFLHELAHIKRYDVLVGWFMCVLQVLHWFNPLVWLAQSRMRADRELACDALVLRSLGAEEPRAYGNTIVNLLERFSQPRYLPALTGILEDKSQLRRRITMIAKFRPQSRIAAALALMLSATVALLALTTAPGLAAPEADKANASVSAPAVDRPADARTGKSPRIVSIQPKNGATEVDPNLKSIRIVFDRPMRDKSWSLVGGGPSYPELNGKPSYDSTHKVLTIPVKLKAAWYYRFRLNSPSHKNFVSSDGVPLEPIYVTFSTVGMSQDNNSPKVVSIKPENGATDVDQDLKVIRIVFDRPMQNGSWSVVGGGPKFPELDGKPAYDSSLKVFTLPVKLKPAWGYELWLNSKSHKNFVSSEGVPLESVHVTFKTGERANKSQPDGTSQTSTTTRTADEIKPSELPKGSKIDERGHIIDKIDYPFVNDPDILGTWASVDFVNTIEQFKPDKRNWKGNLFLKEMIFKAGGKLGSRSGATTWTKGLVLDKQDKTASKYEIKDIQGVKYMFFEWKSGDYTVRHKRPSYYVLRKLPGNGATERNAAAEKAAIESANSWLEFVDTGNYAKNWEEAASFFKSAITQENWEKAIQAARGPLGKVISREIKSRLYTKSLPGAPDGEYVVIQFETKFENKADAIETVTPMLDKDGKWRVSGYYIK